MQLVGNKFNKKQKNKTVWANKPHLQPGSA